MRDWYEWHAPYADPSSALSDRLRLVQRRIVGALDAAPPGRIRVVSACAGQGHDLVGALDGHPRRGDVSARLVELDPRNVAVARELAAAAGLDDVEVVEGDAAVTDAYAGAVPADLVLMCGVFGNVSDADLQRCVRLLPQLCAPGATVVWTRHRENPDITPTLRDWFADAGFTEIGYDHGPDGTRYGVGAHRFAGQPAPLRPGLRLFTFDR